MSSGAPEIGQALARLDGITRRLRRECPWDREQDERTIVPHTLEEAYELADAAYRRDDAKLLDELGDVLFQVHFLALLLEERGMGGLSEVADHCVQKLIRRHPHVFGAQEASVSGGGAPPSTPTAREATTPTARQASTPTAREASTLTAREVLHNWDKIKQREPGREPGVFGEVPDNLPSPLYARKLQRRAASSGFDFPGVEGPIRSVREELAELEGAGTAQQRFDELGDVLFAVVNVARKMRVDPELALRAAADRFRSRVSAGGDLAASEGRSWDDLSCDEQLAYYSRARMTQGGHPQQ